MRQSIYLFILMFISSYLVAQNVEIQGQLKIVNGTQGANKVLTSDANGLTSWQSPTATLIEQHRYLKGGIQRLLDWNIDPITLYQHGIPTDSIYGKVYGTESSGALGQIGRVIFVLDTMNQYPWMFVGTSQSIVSFNRYGCPTTAITGAQGENFLDAYQNTADHLSQCTETNQIFTNANTYGGWKVASKADALLIYQNAIVKGHWIPSSQFSANLWTSTEASGADEATKEWMINRFTGAFSLSLKTVNSYGFGIKTFDN